MVDELSNLRRYFTQRVDCSFSCVVELVFKNKYSALRSRVMWISNPESANGPYADSAYTLGLRLNSWCSLLFSNLFVLIVFHFWRFCSSWIRIHKFSWVRFLFVPNIGKIPRIVYNDQAPTGSRTAHYSQCIKCLIVVFSFPGLREFSEILHGRETSADRFTHSF